MWVVRFSGCKIQHHDQRINKVGEEKERWEEETVNFIAATPYYSICLTKLDILDDFDEIKIGVAYKLDGKTLESMPGTRVFSY